MRLKPILTIFRKDVRDAIRDARVLMAILVPFGLGIFYNLVMDDEEVIPEASVVWAGDGSSQMIDRIRDITGGVVDVYFERADDDAAVRQQIADDEADIGLIIPNGFDAAVTAGEQPPLMVVLPESPSFGGDYVAASLEPVLREMAGQAQPATVQIERVEEDLSGDIISQVGFRKYFVLAAATMLIGMIAMLAVPVVLADEADKRTLDALVMVVSYGEVVIAKALFGVAYMVVSIPLLLVVTSIIPENIALFTAGMGLFGIALIGFGLLLGGIFNATQLNTWGGLLLLPILFPAFSTGLPMPRPLEIASLILPTSHATRIAINGITGQQVFDNIPLSFAALAIWAVAGYGLLLWRLSTRNA